MSKPFSFADEANKADSGSYLKIKEGDNKLRIVTEFILHESTFTDKKTGETKKSKKFVGFVLDRRDDSFKPMFLARTIVDSIADLQMSDDYKFEAVPMPYDINIRAKNAGTIDVIYNVLPLAAAEMTADQLAEIAKLDVADYLAKLDGEQDAQPAPQVQPSAEDMAHAQLTGKNPAGSQLDNPFLTPEERAAEEQRVQSGNQTNAGQPSGIPL